MSAPTYGGLCAHPFSDPVDIVAELHREADLRHEQRLFDLYAAHVARGSVEPFADAEMSLTNWYAMLARSYALRP